MKIWIAIVLSAFAVGTSAQTCSCETLKWATCEESPCSCTILVGNNEKQTLDCTKLIPKCFLMKAEMYRARKGQDTRTIGGKPVETAFVDNDGIYDPECENDGKFKAKQCNNTEECWCVNSAGVRRTDKGDKNLKCEELVETYLVHIQLTHKPLTTPLSTANLKT
ncbi:tumor-associated calcium signal transducer 2-like [Lates japonicus]